MLSNQEKQAIANSLGKYVQRHRSTNAAANTLRGVSSATVSQVLNDNWEQISDSMWRNIAAQVGYSKIEYLHAETSHSKKMMKYLLDAQEESMVFPIISPAGSGKSGTADRYSAEHANVFLLKCDDYWNKKLFLSELLRQMGRNTNGLSVAEMMADIVRTLAKLPNPIIIIDEVDKLPDHVLYFFITLYNRLEDICAFILCATPYFETRMKRGLRLNKKGYEEIWSRLGRKFINIPNPTSQDIMAICHVNGITDNAQIKNIVEDSQNDLRRVKKKIKGIKKDALTAA